MYKDNSYEGFLARGWLDLAESIMRSGANQVLNTGSTPSGTAITNCETAINNALAALSNPATDIRVDLSLSGTTVSLTLVGVAFRTYETD